MLKYIGTYHYYLSQRTDMSFIPIVILKTFEFTYKVYFESFESRIET